jgi:hypothetical protein
MVDTDRRTTEYATPQWLPKTADILVGGGMRKPNGILLVDEANRAPVSVLNGLLSLMQEDRIDKSGYRLPKTSQDGLGTDGRPVPMNWSMVLAGNFADGKNSVQSLDEAFSNRAVHAVLEFDAAGWGEWARGRGLERGVTSFALKNADTLLPERVTELPDWFEVPVTPRSFENLASLYVPGMDREMLRVIAQGTIGLKAADDFMEHIRNHEANAAGQASGVGQLTVENILTGDFAAPLAAELASGAGGEERVAQTVLVMAEDGLAKNRPDARIAGHVAAFLRAVGPLLVHSSVEAIHGAAPEWTPLVSKAYKQLAPA